MFTLARTSSTMVLTRASSRMSSTISKNDLAVDHKPDENMFKMKMNNDFATVLYSKESNVYNLLHSEVPDTYKGQGYGTTLAEKTFDYIAKNNLQMTISCEFLMKVYQANKAKYQSYYKS